MTDDRSFLRAAGSLCFVAAIVGAAGAVLGFAPARMAIAGWMLLFERFGYALVRHGTLASSDGGRAGDRTRRRDPHQAARA